MDFEKEIKAISEIVAGQSKEWRSQAAQRIKQLSTKLPSESLAKNRAEAAARVASKGGLKEISQALAEVEVALKY